MDTWTRSLFARPPILFGRRLRPFSLSHSLLLRAIDSPFAYLNAPASDRDLFAAVDVCARGHAENARAFAVGVNPAWLAAWRWRWRRADMSVASASFRAYIADHTARNVRADVERDADAPSVTGPVEYYLHRHLTEDRGWSDEAAWDCGLGYAWALLDCSQEWQHPGTLRSEYDARLIALMASEAAARKAGRVTEAERIDAEIREMVKANGGRQ